MFFTVTFGILSLLVFLFILKSINSYQHWKKRGIKGPKPGLIFGNLSDVVLARKTIGDTLRDFHNEFPKEKAIGLFQGTTPVLSVVDADIAKTILIKDFDYFTDRGFGMESDIFAENIFQTDGDKWRVLRQRLSPVFTSGKLKKMFYLLSKSANGFEKYIEKLIKKGNNVEVQELTAKYTLDCVGSCVFGMEVNAFNEGENVFRIIGNQLLNLHLKKIIKLGFDAVCPSLLKFFDININDKESIEFFQKLVKDLVQAREGKPKTRHDFVDLLIEMKEQGEITGNKLDHESEYSLKINERLMAAQMVVFYVAGFETSATTMGFALFELAHNPDIQERAFQEVDATFKKHGGFTYEAIQEMVYIDMFISETLRKHPVSDPIPRICVKDYELEELGLTIEKGIKVWFPISCIHFNPRIFPNPQKFDPERFSISNRTQIPSCAYLPFSEGPRNCIGLRFAKVMTALGIATILETFKIFKTNKTQDKLVFKPGALTNTCKDGIWVGMEKRTATT